MKVIQVLNGYLPDQVAGTEVYTSLLSKYLYNQSITVKVLIPNYKASESDSYIHNNIEVIRYAEPSQVDRALILGLRKPEGLKFFEDVLKEEQPDLIHFHELAGSNGITIHHVESARKLGFKIVFTFHLVKYSCKAGNLMYNGSELCDGLINISRCTACNFTSKGLSNLKTELLLPVVNVMYKAGINLGKINNAIGTALSFPFLVEQHSEELKRLSRSVDKIVTLTSWYKSILEVNGVETDQLIHIPQALPQLDHEAQLQSYTVSFPIRLMFLGRISHFKGVHLLINALKDLPQDKIMLDIYGQETEDEYASMCKDESSGLTNIRFRGTLDPDTIITKMQQYHALCLPSTINEMSPLVIQEAFAAGIPVIASDVYGNAEQVQHDFNGLLFQINNVESLKQQLQQIIEKPEKLLDFANNVQQPKNFNEVGATYLDLYHELLKS